MRKISEKACIDSVRRIVSISSPSGEGGEKIEKEEETKYILVSISSPSGEGGERELSKVMEKFKKLKSFH